MKNWLVAVIAIAMGIGVSAALLLLGNPSRGAVEVYALARSVSAGDSITPDALRFEPIVAGGSTTSLLTAADGSTLAGARAAHDLMAGQLLQRSDLTDAQSLLDERLVLLPLKDVPPALAGQKVDLYVLGGTPESPTVLPFASGVVVRAVVTGGLVVGVPSRQASAFVYAAELMRLVAVLSAAGSPPGAESPISTPDQAMAAVGQQ